MGQAKAANGFAKWATENPYEVYKLAEELRQLELERAEARERLK